MTEMVLIGTVQKNGAEEVRVALSSFRGTAVVDVRTYSESGDAVERRPTTKGVALNVARLPDLIAALQPIAGYVRRWGAGPDDPGTGRTGP